MNRMLSTIYFTVDVLQTTLSSFFAERFTDCILWLMRYKSITLQPQLRITIRLHWHACSSEHHSSIQLIKQLQCTKNIYKPHGYCCTETIPSWPARTAHTQKHLNLTLLERVSKYDRSDDAKLKVHGNFRAWEMFLCKITFQNSGLGLVQNIVIWTLTMSVRNQSPNEKKSRNIAWFLGPTPNIFIL